MNPTETFIVIFPCGDRSRVSVVDITGAEWERDDYALASVHTFTSRPDAEQYAERLAAEHSRLYVGKPSPLDAGAQP